MPVPLRTIVVTGDVTIDWLLLSEQRGSSGPVDFIWMWGGEYACRALVSAGGAASHADILRYAVREAPGYDVTVVGPEVPHEALMSPRDPGYAHTFADIAPFPRALGAANDHAWRIAEFKGTDPARAARQEEAPPPEAVDTVMIVDHASGYRQRFPDLPALLAAGPRHILWQTGAPLAGSPLADVLLRDHSDRLTVLTSSDELRKAGEQVGYPLSWERLTDEVLAAVHAQGLDAARRVITSRPWATGGFATRQAFIRWARRSSSSPGALPTASRSSSGPETTASRAPSRSRTSSAVCEGS